MDQADETNLNNFCSEVCYYIFGHIIINDRF